MNKLTFDDLSEAYDRLMGGLQDFKNLVRQNDKMLYERWKAGGFIVDEDILSMYPNATKVFESFEAETEEEEDEDEEEE